MPSRVSESVYMRPNDLYIGGLLQRLEREHEERLRIWRQTDDFGAKHLALCWYWAVGLEIKQLNDLWVSGDSNIEIISKSDYAKMRAASGEYVCACMEQEKTRLDAKLAAHDLAIKNKELAAQHRERERLATPKRLTSK